MDKHTDWRNLIFILTDTNSYASPDALASLGYVVYNTEAATCGDTACGLNKVM